jgi:2,3-diketo-5-methylthio-1-phosphopentane phosphatase
VSVAVFVDFDDTATTRNAAHYILNKFAPDAMKKFRSMFLAGEMSFVEYQERAFNAIEAPLAEVQEAVAAGIELRLGFSDLVRAVRAVGGSITVVSAGLDIYIEPVLRRNGLADVPIACGVAVRDGAETGPFRYDYPFGGGHCECDTATCKRDVVKAAPAGVATVFAGDSKSSDGCAARVAGKVFARDRLLSHCQANGIPVTPFEDFFPVVDFVNKLAASQAAEPGR